LIETLRLAIRECQVLFSGLQAAKHVSIFAASREEGPPIIFQKPAARRIDMTSLP